MVLIGYWPLNEASGDTAYDRSGQNNHGTVNGATMGANGIIGKNAYEFNGADNTVDCGQNIVSGEAEGISFSAWINPTSIDANNGAGVVTEMYNPSNDIVQFEIGLSGSGNTSWQEDNFASAGLYDGTTWHKAQGSEITSGWTLLTGTYDGQTIRVYINGSLEDAYDSTVGVQTPDEEYKIGRRHDTHGTDNFFDGRIADVRVYNHALTQEEVQYLYSVGKRGLQTTGKKSS